MFYTVKLVGNQTPATNLRQRHTTPRSRTTLASVARVTHASLGQHSTLDFSQYRTSSSRTAQHLLVSRTSLAQQQQRASRSTRHDLHRSSSKPRTTTLEHKPLLATTSARALVTPHPQQRHPSQPRTRHAPSIRRR